VPQKGKIRAEEKIAAVEAWQQGRMSRHGIAHSFGINKKTLLSKVPHNAGPRLWRGPAVLRFFI